MDPVAASLNTSTDMLQQTVQIDALKRGQDATVTMMQKLLDTVPAASDPPRVQTPGMGTLVDRYA